MNAQQIKDYFKCRFEKETNKLLKDVPTDQMAWFNKKMNFLKDLLKKIEDFMSFDDLILNIEGEGYRYPEYFGNSNSFLDEFRLAYSASKKNEENCNFLIECLESAMLDSADNDFFELAFNLKMIYEDFYKIAQYYEDN